MSYNIPANSWGTLSGVNQTLIGNPLTIGTNLILSQTGLSAPRTITFPNITDQVDTLTSTNSLTNKTINSGLNTLQGIWQSPISGRYGEMQPVAGTTGNTALTTTVVSGALGLYVATAASGTLANVYDTSEGLTVTIANSGVTNAFAGFLSPTGAPGLCRTIFAGRVRCRFKQSSIASGNFFFGLTSLSAVLGNATPLATTDSGVIIGWRSSDSTFQIFNNDASGAEIVTPATGPINTDVNWHTLEINWPAGGAVINTLIDGVATGSPATRIPATTTPLFLDIWNVATASTVTTMSLHGVTAELQK